MLTSAAFAKLAKLLDVHTASSISVAALVGMHDYF